MRWDASMAFVQLGANLSLVAAAGVNIASNVLDLLGLGVNVPASQAAIIGNAGTFRMDPGVGRVKQEIVVALNSGVAVASAGGATLNVALQLAPDAGAGVVGAWQTITETGPLTVAQLEAARTGALQQMIKMDWPPEFPQNLNPRFARLLFQVPAALNFDTGQVYGAGVTTVRDDFANRQASKNYTVA